MIGPLNLLTPLNPIILVEPSDCDKEAFELVVNCIKTMPKGAVPLMYDNVAVKFVIKYVALVGTDPFNDNNDEVGVDEIVKGTKKNPPYSLLLVAELATTLSSAPGVTPPANWKEVN